jgi:uncharacterized protein
MFTDQLIIFTRYPIVGQAKTRLIPALGASGAAALHRQMTAHTMVQVQNLQAIQKITATIYFAGATEPSEMARWLGCNWQYQQQVTGDLGRRMAQAFIDSFAVGMKRVVVMGTDCPGITAHILQAAFEQLSMNDVVLGPAIDGGYYLIGLRSMIPELFVDMPWSTDAVLSQTMEIAQKLNRSVALLPLLADVDRPADLPVWEKIQAVQNHCDQTISVIIPALNEAQTIEKTITSTQNGDQSVEVIVVDGGSIDDTVKIAQASGAKVLSFNQGRAHQMNMGAQAATGQILLFLHADTCLPIGFDRLIHTALTQINQKSLLTIAGAFELKINGTATGLRLVEWGVRWRSRLFQMPYGDQAIFLRADTFRQMGGFPAMPLMEDFELILQLQRLGKIKITPAAVVTSARRWQQKGILQTTIINQIIVIAYLCGVAPDRLAQWYRRKKS